MFLLLPSFVLRLDARVHKGVDDIHHQIDHAEHHREQDNRAQHAGGVLGGDAGQQEIPHPGPGEHVLNDDDSPQQRTELEAGHRDDGDPAVAHAVVENHRHLAHAFGPGGAHIVLPDDLQHGGAGDAGDVGGAGGPHRKGGQDQVLEGTVPA